MGKSKATGKSQTEEADDSALFRQKLVAMIKRIDQSLKLIRQQITVNQNAPFLADLYLQLSELLSQKANAMYYVQMEKMGRSDTISKVTTKFKDVVRYQREAMGILLKILKEFPKFDKEDKTLYLLALVSHSIDEKARFEDTTQELLKKYPGTQDSMRGRLLLAQFYSNRDDDKRALSVIASVMKSKFPYERNLARYRAGLIYMKMNKNKNALDMFAKIATDERLKEEDNPFDISLKNKTVKSSIKREALIESIRPFTNHFKKNPKPVQYYSNIAPTEIYFQEVIEKLAQRYVYLKKYDHAIKLLRTLSEREAEQQKIVQIYRDVLIQIPIQDRINLPIDEMTFLLQKYNEWIQYYKISKKVKAEAEAFFEKQIRELGTTAHAYAKRTTNKKRKKKLLARAKAFYDLYLGFFKGSPRSASIAINLADVFFAEKDYLHSGEYYLRTFSGEFGKTKFKKKLIRNALLSLQKPSEYSFYDQVRAKGLLIRTIEEYQKFDPRKKRDSRLNFVKVRTEYEQGFYEDALDGLLVYMKKHPRTKYAVSAGELILDYFNTRADFQGLTTWSDKILKTGVKNRKFVKKVKAIAQRSRIKAIEERVKAQSGYDSFSEGKSYLQAALTLENPAMRDAALQEALNRSKQEKDIETFFKTATVLMNKAESPKKKSMILESMERENIRLGRYYRVFRSYEKRWKNQKGTRSDKIKALTDAADLALLLKDWVSLEKVMKNRLYSKLPRATQSKIRQQVIDLFDSPVKVRPILQKSLLKTKWSARVMLALFKSQYRLSSTLKNKAMRSISARCRRGKPTSAVCKWWTLKKYENSKKSFVKTIRRAPPTPGTIEKLAPRFQRLVRSYAALEGSGDIPLDLILSLRNAEIYRSFGQYLMKVAAKNKDLRSILMQNARESLGTAKRYHEKCKKIVRQAQPLHPSRRACYQEETVSIRAALRWNNIEDGESKRKDLESGKVSQLQRAIFVNAKNGNAFLNLTKTYFDEGYFHHAAASSMYGMSSFGGKKGAFRALLGCSVMNLGLISEAKYHLIRASNFKGLRRRCLILLNERKEHL